MKRVLFFLIIVMGLGFLDKEEVSFASENSEAGKIKITYETSFDSIKDSEKGYLYLMVSNPSKEDIVVEGIQIYQLGSNDLDLYFEGKKVSSTLKDKTIRLRTNGTIGKYSDELYTFEVKGGTKLSSFEHKIMMRVKMKSGFLTVNKLITVKILTKTSTFNSGAINDMFGIPALLFLPGLIFTVLFLFVLQLQKISWVIEISYKEPIFWIMAVPISICITFFYSVCGNAHSSTDYEIRDIMWLWIVSVILAVIMGIGYGVVHQNFYVKKHRFHDKDSALDVINKIWSKYKTLELDFIKLKGQTEDEEWILLEKNQDGLSVVCQTIFVKTSSKITQGEADKILKELDGKEKEQVKIINKKRKNIELYWGVGSREKILFVDPIQIIETGTRASVLNME